MIVRLSAERLRYGSVVVESFAKRYRLSADDRFQVLRYVQEEGSKPYIMVRHTAQLFVTFLFAGEYEAVHEPALYIHEQTCPYDTAAL